MRMLYVSGQWAQPFDFESMEKWRVWLADVMEIKDNIAKINDDGNPGPPREGKYREWLELVSAFQKKYGGESYVPPDIKKAVNTVEDGIGAKVTKWAEDADFYAVKPVSYYTKDEEEDTRFFPDFCYPPKSDFETYSQYYTRCHFFEQAWCRLDADDGPCPKELRAMAIVNGAKWSWVFGSSSSSNPKRVMRNDDEEDDLDEHWKRSVEKAKEWYAEKEAKKKAMMPKKKKKPNA